MDMGDISKTPRTRIHEVIVLFFPLRPEASQELFFFYDHSTDRGVPALSDRIWRVHCCPKIKHLW